MTEHWKSKITPGKPLTEQDLNKAYERAVEAARKPRVELFDLMRLTVHECRLLGEMWRGKSLAATRFIGDIDRIEALKEGLRPNDVLPEA